MKNTLIPQRLETESFEDYKARRNARNRIVKNMTRAHGGSKTSRDIYRDKMRESGSMAQQAGSFGRGIRNAITRKALQAIKAAP